MPALRVKQREQFGLDHDIPLNAFGAACFLGQFTAKAGIIPVRDVVLSAFYRILERIVGFYDFAEAGFIAGLLIPSTKVEDERLGPVADQVKEQARQTGQEAIEHGKQIAQDTAETAADKAQEVVSEVKDTAQESAQQHAEDLKASAHESAQTVKQTGQQ